MKRILVLCAFLSLTSMAAEEIQTTTSNNGFFDTTDLVVVEKPTRSVNFRVNPINLAVGCWNVDVDIAVADWLTVGPTFTYYTGNRTTTGFLTAGGGTDKTKFGAYNFGVRANIYFSNHRFQDGWILAPFAGIAPGSVALNRNGKEFEGKFNGIVAGLLFSRQWIWESGLNINLGAGVAYLGLPDNAPVTSKSGDGEVAQASVMEMLPFRTGRLVPTFDLTLGFAL